MDNESNTLTGDELRQLAEEAAESDVNIKVRVKRYLGTIQRMTSDIYQKSAELQQLREDAASIKGMAYDGVKVQSGGSGDQLERTVAKYLDLEAEIEREIAEKWETKHRIINEIQGLENEEYKTLLYKRYIEYKGLEKISLEMNFTYEYIRRMHGKALQYFWEKYLMEVSHEE